jgi:hypothetical protein
MVTYVSRKPAGQFEEALCQPSPKQDFGLKEKLFFTGCLID